MTYYYQTKNFPLSEDDFTLIALGLNHLFRNDSSIDMHYLRHQTANLRIIYTAVHENEMIFEAMASFIGQESKYLKKLDSQYLLSEIYLPLAMGYQKALFDYQYLYTLENQHKKTKLSNQQILEKIEPELYRINTHLAEGFAANPLYSLEIKGLVEYSLKFFMSGRAICLLSTIYETAAKKKDLPFTKKIIPHLEILTQESNHHLESLILIKNSYALTLEKNFMHIRPQLFYGIRLFHTVFDEKAITLYPILFSAIVHFNRSPQSVAFDEFLAEKIPALIKIYEHLQEAYAPEPERIKNQKISKAIDDLRNLLLNKPHYFNQLGFFAQGMRTIGTSFIDQIAFLEKNQYSSGRIKK